jgi:hypothetical protein
MSPCFCSVIVLVLTQPGWMWYHFPWQTPEAAKCDYRLGAEERTELQQVILDQAWFTLGKFKHTAARICKLWVEKHWNLADMEDATYLENYLETDTAVIRNQVFFYDAHGKKLTYYGYGNFKIQDGDNILYSHLETNVVEVLYLPLKLFVGPGSPSKVDFLYFLRRFGSTPACPNPAVREAVLSAALSDPLSAALCSVV